MSALISFSLDVSKLPKDKIIEGKKVFDMCVIRTAPCDHENPCSIHQKMAPVRQEMKQIFKTETIADLVSEYREGNQQVML